MSEQNEKLTALNVTVQLQDFYKNNTDKGAGFPQRLIKLFAAQQVEHATAELRKEIEQLKEWKRQHMEVTSPLFDYGQSKEAGLPLGSSIVHEAIKAMKECIGLRQELDLRSDNFNKIVEQLNDSEAQRLELRKELEAKENGNNNLKVALEEARKSISKAASVETEAFKQIESIKTQLAEAQRQRDEAVTKWQGAMDANLEKDVEVQEARKQRDEAADLIKRYLSRKGSDNILVSHDLDMDCEEWLSRLSSGETKPASPWIHVKEYPPVLHKWYLVATPFCSYPSMAGQYNGEKWISTDQNESEIYNVEYYMEHPAPPESLTDKPE